LVTALLFAAMLMAGLAAQTADDSRKRISVEGSADQTNLRREDVRHCALTDRTSDGLSGAYAAACCGLGIANATSLFELIFGNPARLGNRTIHRAFPPRA